MSLSILSFLAIVSILPISFIARDFDWKSGLLLARQLTLPMGLVVTLMLLAKLLGMMGDPSMLYSMLAESMLPSVFALMQYTILSQIDAQVNATSTLANPPGYKGLSLESSCCTLDCKDFFRTSLASILYLHLVWVSLVYGGSKIDFHLQRHRPLATSPYKLHFECMLS